MAEQEEEERYMAKQELKQKRMFAATSDRRSNIPHTTVKQTFSLADGYKIKNNTSNNGIQSIVRPS